MRPWWGTRGRCWRRRWPTGRSTARSSWRQRRWAASASGGQAAVLKHALHVVLNAAPAPQEKPAAPAEPAPIRIATEFQFSTTLNSSRRNYVQYVLVPSAVRVLQKFLKVGAWAALPGRCRVSASICCLRGSWLRHRVARAPGCESLRPAAPPSSPCRRPAAAGALPRARQPAAAALLGQAALLLRQGQQDQRAGWVAATERQPRLRGQPPHALAV
jgi:hypothetical protein